MKLINELRDDERWGSERSNRRCFILPGGFRSLIIHNAPLNV